MPGELGDTVHAAKGDTSLEQLVSQSRRVMTREDLGDDRVHRRPVGAALHVTAEIAMGRQRGIPQDLGTEARPLALVLDRDDDRYAVLRRISLVGGDSRMHQ